MTALAALYREFRIAYYERALKELQQRDPTHCDLPAIVRHLHTLRAQRPRVVLRKPTPCPPFMCAGHVDCADRHCPGLYQRDGGHEFSHGVAWPIERDDTARTPIST